LRLSSAREKKVFAKDFPTIKLISSRYKNKYIETDMRRSCIYKHGNICELIILNRITRLMTLKRIRALALF